MTLDIKNMTHVERDVGQHIKSTKKHFIWEFTLDSKNHKIELYDSRLSGKKKLIKDGQVWKEVEEDVAFSKTFEIGKHSCTIIQHGEKYELRIDNQSYNHLMDLEKNKVYFTSGSNPTSNSYTAKAGVNNKKGFGVGNVNDLAPSDNKQRPSGLFNFTIKPANNNANNFSNVKFNFGGIKNENNSGNNGNNNQSVDNNQATNNNALLIDFSSDMNTNSNANPTESKVNTINLLGGIDFNNENPHNNQNYENNDLFQQMNTNNLVESKNVNPNLNSVNFNDNLMFSENFGNNFSHGMNEVNSMNFPSNVNFMGREENFGNTNNMNNMNMGNVNNNFGNFNQNDNYGYNQDNQAEVRYPELGNVRYQVNTNVSSNFNLNSNPKQNTGSKDPLDDLFG